jgi:hypothetical protein
MAKAAKKAAAKPKKPKADKKPRTKKSAAAAPVPEAKGSVPQDNVPKADPKMRELALHHRDTYIKRKAALSKAQRDMQALGKEVKGDGLTMRQIKLMVELSTPEGEAAWRMTVANDLIAAQYQGAAVGQQLVLFLEPDRTPAVDIAYDSGVQDSMEGKAAKPGFHPSTPQHASYMKGYHDETERRVKAKGGISKLETGEPAPTRTDEMAGKRAAAITDAPAGTA